MKQPARTSNLHEQLILKVPIASGARIPLRIRATNVGTPDSALIAALSASIKLLAGGGCFCKQRYGKRHRLIKCGNCSCHRRTRK